MPGYDPVIQAMAGYMEITGDPDGPPMLTGVPVIDLKAGDEVYANVLLALAERAETGRGKRIDVSMLQAAASWLITTLPLVDFDCDPSEITRAGNEHRKFIPTNVYPTRDGFVYLAIGSDVQWKRLDRDGRCSRRWRGRRARPTRAGTSIEPTLRGDMTAVTRQHTTDGDRRDAFRGDDSLGGDQRHPAGARAAGARRQDSRRRARRRARRSGCSRRP